MAKLEGMPVKGLLCDITGVLVESSSTGDGTEVPGSANALDRLREAGIKVKLITNESQRTRSSLHAKLTRLGVKVAEEDIITPALAMASIIRERGLTPHLLVHPNVVADLGEVQPGKQPDCVVLGDAAQGFNYDNLNKAFRVLASQPSAPLFSLGKGKFYREDGQLDLDVGAFAAALEFAGERAAEVCGKPGVPFFKEGLKALGLAAEEVVMVGDDVVSDVGGAQKAGVRGVLVRTGKYRAEVDEPHHTVKPDQVVDNLAALVDILLSKN